MRNELTEALAAITAALPKCDLCKQPTLMAPTNCCASIVCEQCAATEGCFCQSVDDEDDVISSVTTEDIAIDCAIFACDQVIEDEPDLRYLTPEDLWQCCPMVTEDPRPMPAEFPYLYLAEVWKRDPEIFRAIVACNTPVTTAQTKFVLSVRRSQT